MEKGMVRCDVNVSVRPKGATTLGAKIEIKNMNSFSGVRRALDYESPRQIEVVSKGGTLVQSTRRWDDVGGITEEMRTKEDAHDYRYFPEPDLMPFEPTPEWLAEVKSRVVELPLARKQRFMQAYQLPAGDAEVFKNDVALGNYFETVAKGSGSPKAVANWVINNLRAKLAETNEHEIAEQESMGLDRENMTLTGLADLKFTSDALVELVGLVENKTLSSSTAQQVFAEMFQTGKAASAIVQEKGLAQVSDTGALEAFCDEAIAANPGPAADFRAGKSAALNRIKGHVMKLSRGKANPTLVGEILERKLRG
jgi:aspartyl-tRNA(Asn)/glutamyl-tRNA(Gln) amidotransferase subunit B